jgi:hypothetical protein
MQLQGFMHQHQGGVPIPANAGNQNLEYQEYLRMKASQPDPVKREIERLNNLLAEMQGQLANKPVEVSQPKPKLPDQEVKKSNDGKAHLAKLLGATLALTVGSIWLGNLVIANIQQIMWGVGVLLFVAFLAYKPKNQN